MAEHDDSHLQNNNVTISGKPVCCPSRTDRQRSETVTSKYDPGRNYRQMRSRYHRPSVPEQDGVVDEDEKNENTFVLVVFHLMTVFELKHAGNKERLRLTDGFINSIIRFMEIHRLRLVRRDFHSNVFYFSVLNLDSSCDEVIADLNRLKKRLKRICFAGVVGRFVSGREINDIDDLILSFRLSVINGTLHGLPSTDMFV